MSTRWYIECLDHDPHPRSDSDGLFESNVAEILDHRPEVVAMSGWLWSFTNPDRPAWWLRQHPHCRLAPIDEHDRWLEDYTAKCGACGHEKIRHSDNGRCHHESFGAWCRCELPQIAIASGERRIWTNPR